MYERVVGCSTLCNTLPCFPLHRNIAAIGQETLKNLPIDLNHVLEVHTYNNNVPLYNYSIYCTVVLMHVMVASSAVQSYFTNRRAVGLPPLWLPLP